MKISVRYMPFFILGLLTTIQLLAIGGVTAFNVVLVLTVVFAIIYSRGHINKDRYFIVSFIATVITTLCAIGSAELTEGFKHSAIMGGIVYICIIVSYLFMKSNVKYAQYFLNGFEISCKLTLVWCILQLLFFYLLHIDINAVFFGNFLSVINATGHSYNGSIIPSGFYSHRGILIPSLLFLFFSTSNIIILVLIILIGVLTRSVAIILGLMIAVLFKIYCAKKSDRLNKRKISFLLLGIIVVAAIAIYRSSEVAELVAYISGRIGDITSNKADNSSVVHFLYYKNFGDIIKNLNLIDVLFGTGLGTSGQHYTWFSGQYSNLDSWIVESDYINIFLSQGIVGFGLYLYLMFKIIALSKKYHYHENILFIIVLMFVGIMYNSQFQWFVLVELSILVLSLKGENVFNRSEIKRINKHILYNNT